MDVPLETLFLIDIKLCVRFVTNRLRKLRMWYSPETLTTATCHTQYKHTELTRRVGSPDLYTLTHRHIGTMLCYTTTAYQLVFLRHGGLGRIMCQVHLNYELHCRIILIRPRQNYHLHPVRVKLTLWVGQS